MEIYFPQLFEHLNRKINEMQDTPIVTITRVVDDDTGIWAGDEFEFGLHADYRDNYAQDPKDRKRLADELRKVADMIEKDDSYEKKDVD